MKRPIKHIVTACLLVGSLLGLAGCGGEEYTYVPDRELKPGPGLVTGPEGAFTLYGQPAVTPPPSPKQPAPVRQ